METTVTELTWVALLKTSIVMPVLLVLSILILAQGLERLWSFWTSGGVPHSLWKKIRELIKTGDLDEAAHLCRAKSGILAEAFSDLLQRDIRDLDGWMDAYQIHRQQYQIFLSRRLGLFGTASFISPLIGLLGTVLGVMRAFHDLARAGAGGPTVVAAGISEALVSTAAGIGVAVLSAVLYNYFTLTLKYRMNLLDLWASQLADLLPRKIESEPVAKAEPKASVKAPAPMDFGTQF